MDVLTLVVMSAFYRQRKDVEERSGSGFPKIMGAESDYSSQTRFTKLISTTTWSKRLWSAKLDIRGCIYIYMGDYIGITEKKMETTTMGLYREMFSSECHNNPFA